MQGFPTLKYYQKAIIMLEINYDFQTKLLISSINLRANHQGAESSVDEGQIDREDTHVLLPKQSNYEQVEWALQLEYA